MTCLHPIQTKLRAQSSAKDAAILARFFKTGPGEYGEGDQFLGVRVPHIRSLLRMDSEDVPIEELMSSPWHEERLLALLILVRRFEKGDEQTRKRIFDNYLSRSSRVNNWDLVDLSAPQIVGGWLLNGQRAILDKLASAPSLWERRIAMVSTLTFIRHNQLNDTFRLAESLISDPHDLIHKASGWMLREAGKRNMPALESFLWTHLDRLPRTTLRYAIEKFPENERKRILAA